MNQLRKQPLYPFLLLISLGITWGTSFSIAKFAMGNGVTPLGYSFWQSFGPAVLIFLIVFLKERKIPTINKLHLSYYFLCGLLGIVLPNIIMYFSAVNVPSGILGLIVNTSPVITYFLSIMFNLEKFSINRFLGIITGFIGLFILFYPNLNNQFNFYWMLFALLTPIFLASCTIFMVKLRPDNTSSLALSSGMLIAATLVTSPIVISTGHFHPIVFPLNTPDLFILIEIVLSSLGYVLFFELLKVAGPVFYSLVGCIVALSGLLWGYLAFSEKIKGLEIFAVIFILAAILLVSLKQKEAVPEDV